MLIPNMTEPPDFVARTAGLIDVRFRDIHVAIAQSLHDAIVAVAKNDNHTAQEFWDRVGTGGAALLQALGTWRAILQSGAPDLVSETIAGAGSTLTVNDDGTVTVG